MSDSHSRHTKKKLKVMAGKCSVKAVWDRKSQSAKMGHGYVEIVVYLSAGQRKYMAFGKATAMEWMRIQRSRDLAKQIAKYEEIVNAMRTLGEEMTVANFESHLDLKEVVEESKKDSGMMFNGFDQTSSFIEYMEQSVENEELYDVPIENVARMLGHHDVRTTQVYAKVLKSSIERYAESVAAMLL